MDNSLDAGLEHAFDLVADSLQKYFKDRSKSSTTKISLKLYNEDNDIFFDMYGNDIQHKHGHSLDESTAFYEVSTGGIPYIKNNIVLEALNDRYKSPRLDTEKVTMYLRKNYTWLRKLKDKFKYNDDLWASCWHSVDINGEITTSQVAHLGLDDCPKSILVMPLFFNVVQI